jgi:hypothetical protein
MMHRRRALSRLRLQAWARSVAFTMALSLLVAWGVGDEGRLLPVTVLAVAGIGLGFLYLLFPRGLHFAFGTATGLALYSTLFVVLGRAQFPDAPDWSRAPAFLLPVVAFLAMVWWRREELSRIAEHLASDTLEELPHAARWLVFVALVGLFCFVLPVNRAAPATQGAALLAAMGAIALMVTFAVRDVVRLLIDVALIIDELTARARHLAVPVVAFLLMYALLVIGFASAYRIADGLSLVPLFHGPDGAIRLSYSDALHFSVATLSTVGYGDIRPTDDGVRVLSSAQVVAGQLLLLFGFAEIMRSRRVRGGAEGRLDPGHAAGHSPPSAHPPGHGPGKGLGGAG